MMDMKAEILASILDHETNLKIEDLREDSKAELNKKRGVSSSNNSLGCHPTHIGPHQSRNELSPNVLFAAAFTLMRLLFFMTPL